MPKAVFPVIPLKEKAHTFLHNCHGLMLYGFFGAILILNPVLAPAVMAEKETPTQEMSNTVEVLCPELAAINREDPLPPAQLDVLNRCGEVKINTAAGQDFDSLSSAQKDGLTNMTSEQTSTMNTISVEITQTQFAAIVGRLDALRGGTPGHLSLNFKGADAEPVLYAGPITLASANDAGSYQIGDSGKLGVFLNGSWGTGDKDVTDFEPGFDYDGWDVIGGADYRFANNFVLGGAFGYSQINADVDNDGGSVDADGYAFSLYALYYWDALYINAIGSIGRRDYDTVRNVRYMVDVPVDQSFSGDTDADDYNISLGGGYDFSTNGFTYGPYAQLRYFKSEIDGYSESLEGNNTNPGFGLALDINDQTVKSFTSALGGQVSYARSTDVGVFLPYFRLGWVHEFENDARTITGRFINVPDDPEVAALNHININTDSPDRNYFDLGLGISTVFPRGVQAFLNYQTLLGLDDVNSHLVSGGIRLEF